MFKYRSINLGFFVIALLAVIGIHQTNLVSAKNLPTQIRTSNNKEIISLDTIATTISQPNKNIIAINKVSNVVNSESLAAFQEDPSSLGEDSFEPPDNNQEIENLSTKIFRIFFLYFFMLLFVPFGIFYPFFIFYQWLLSVEQDELTQLDGDYASASATAYFNPKNQGLESKQDNYHATVSKLQIAFSSQADELQQKLSQVILNVEINQDQGLIELMRKTISVLINQQYWTHVGHSSIPLTLKDIEAEFDTISATERSKVIRKKVNISNGNTEREKSRNFSQTGCYNYTVVTLIFCTFHNKPLFNNIHTKEQLIKELVKLGRMQQDHLIKFELLWSPQTADNYINNNQLLREYSDMLRLF